MNAHIVTIRWHVRLEHVRHSRFGEPRRATIAWAVRPYRTTPGGARAYLYPDAAPAYFPNLPRALAYARAECARRYRRIPKTRRLP